MTDQPQGNGQPPRWGGPPQGPPAQKHPKRKKWPLIVGGVVLALVVLGIIGSISDGSETTTAAAISTTVVPTTTTAAPTTTTTAPITTTTTTTASVPVTTVAAQVPPPVGQVRVPMPNVVCKNLQVAQDTIQAAGVFYSRSTDATGAGRMQVLDRNWVVVGQTPAPGVLIGEGDAVLSVVKLTESNPC
ncbi:MAG: hypothetical protein ACXVGB_12165 [Mycobacteriaceae bacterium]